MYLSGDMEDEKYIFIAKVMTLNLFEFSSAQATRRTPQTQLSCFKLSNPFNAN
jgi:hypothetical protein